MQEYEYVSTKATINKYSIPVMGSVVTGSKTPTKLERAAAPSLMDNTTCHSINQPTNMSHQFINMSSSDIVESTDMMKA
jgi:hypothetical protein